MHKQNSSSNCVYVVTYVSSSWRSVVAKLTYATSTWRAATRISIIFTCTNLKKSDVKRTVVVLVLGHHPSARYQRWCGGGGVESKPVSKCLLVIKVDLVYCWISPARWLLVFSPSHPCSWVLHWRKVNMVVKSQRQWIPLSTIWISPKNCIRDFMSHTAAGASKLTHFTTKLQVQYSFIIKENCVL